MSDKITALDLKPAGELSEVPEKLSLVPNVLLSYVDEKKLRAFTEMYNDLNRANELAFRSAYWDWRSRCSASTA